MNGSTTFKIRENWDKSAKDFITFHTKNFGDELGFGDEIILLGRKYSIQGFNMSDENHSVVYIHPDFNENELFAIRKLEGK